jgi:hypothetical protein
MGRAALTPGFGDPRRAVNQLRGELGRFGEPAIVIQIDDRAERFALIAAADAAP